MERTADLTVAAAATAGTLVLVAAGEVLGAGGPLLKMLPLLVYFVYVAVPKRGVRRWLGAVALVTLVALAWLLA